jgi:hypothetical protein
MQGAPAAPVKEQDIALPTTIQAGTPSVAALKNPATIPGNVIASPPTPITPVANRRQSGGTPPTSKYVASAVPRVTAGNTRVRTSEMQLRSSPPPALPPSEVRSDQTDGQFDEASEHAVNPFGIVDPRQARVYANVGDDYMRLAKYGKAVEFYQDAIAFAPGDQSLQEKLKQAHVKAGDE